MKKPLTIGMVAGEVSGDNLAAPVIREIRKRYPDAHFAGIGGSGMLSEEFDSWFGIDRLSVNGIVEPLKRLPELLGILFTLRKRFIEDPPDVFVGVDFNFFNLLLEGLLKKHGIATVHYVSPTVWAWRKNRIKRIARNVDLMLTLYPFEAEIYRKNNIDVCFVGHPKADEHPLDALSTDIKKKFGFSPDDRILSLLPGSRGSEIKYSAPDFFRAARICLEKVPQLKFIVPCVNQDRIDQVGAILKQVAPDMDVKLVEGQSAQVMQASDVVLVNSGTATLEALLLKKPMVMSYRMGRWSYALISRLTTISHFALPNILAGRRLVPEFIQDQATPLKLAKAVTAHLLSSDQAELMKSYRAIHQQLRKNAALSASNAIIDLIESRKVTGEKDSGSL